MNNEKCKNSMLRLFLFYGANTQSVSIQISISISFLTNQLIQMVSSWCLLWYTLSSSFRNFAWKTFKINNNELTTTPAHAQNHRIDDKMAIFTIAKLLYVIYKVRIAFLGQFTLLFVRIRNEREKKISKLINSIKCIRVWRI